MEQILSATDVFVSNTFPAHTYNERQTTDLREKITKYLAKGNGECLVINGASKTGKTVLVERWLPPESAIWIKGDEIHSVDDLYRRVIDDLGLFTEVTRTESTSGTVGSGGGVEAGVGSILRFSMNLSAAAEVEETTSSGRTQMNVSVVKASLRRKPVPIVIDDFHFLDKPLRLAVAKAVKDLARLTRVVLIAIPHAAFEPLQDLQDLDWRVIHLEVKRWGSEELAQIAHDGFELLGLVDHGETIGRRLAEESRGAPAIMQVLCLEYVTEVLDVWTVVTPKKEADEPRDWNLFLRQVATQRKPSAFDAIIKGKKTRGKERLARELVDGRQTDIYGAVLLTISEMGVVLTTSKNAIAQKMNQIVVDAPKPETVSGTLGHLSSIAENVRGQGDPALTYSDPELQILDPFLAFYLAHGEWELPEPIEP
ncbi:hypothetical protein ACWPKO_22565 (plasmid) [Coraliomargarita sp. W4R53]